MARVLIIAGCVLLALGVGLGAYQGYSRYQDAVARQQVDRYTAEVQKPAQEAGMLVRQTIVPELDGLANHSVPAAKVSIDAGVWEEFFVRTRAEFARAPHPGRLDSVAQQFDRALAEYTQAVADFQLLATPGKAAAALKDGQAQAGRADCDYAQAAGALADLRSSLDLPAVSTFQAAGACPKPS